jgi:hypothetical protein
MQYRDIIAIILTPESQTLSLYASETSMGFLKKRGQGFFFDYHYFKAGEPPVRWLSAHLIKSLETISLFLK